MRVCLLVIALTGCSSLVPAAGSYSFGDVNAPDACLPLTGFEDEAIALSVDAESDGFELSYNDQITFDCTLDGDSFTCGDEPFTSPAGDLDATLTTTFAVSGDFIDEETIDPLLMSFTYECDGADCAQIEADSGFDAPCTTNVQTSATLDSE